MIDERSVVIVREGSFMIGGEGNDAYTQRQTVSGSVLGIRFGFHRVCFEWLFVFGWSLSLGESMAGIDGIGG